ncbi:MAG: cytochrome P450 [Deltaproteobacteria bacterium]|nr:cytochrome P450 [Deltaproteobacteria bacterium]MBW2385281.1 cytochrome P450 [Deltaproteobacteria bacterium]MBW2695931.1 cytochrome P450 [Deltaproteobacteria bacterium]
MQAVNLYDSATFEREMPHDYFTWLREHEPVHWQPPSEIKANLGDLMRAEQHGYWALTRHKDIIEVSLDQKRFSSERGTVITTDLNEERAAQLRLWMINQDAPNHTKLRKLVNKGFTLRMINNMEPHIRKLSSEIVDSVARKGECDFVASIASELPLLVIAELVGCPLEDRRKLFDWSNQMVGFEDPDFANEAGATDAMSELFEYAGHLAAKRRSDPRDDLTSVLVHAEVDGERLDELGFNMFFILLILAGNETTRNAISGGMLALSENRDQWQKLLDDRSLMPTATEEILRYVSPVITMRRTATCDTEIAGQSIRENDKVVMFYPSANRDADVFENPHQLDVTRDPNPHLAFGWGPHFCLGASLARGEIRSIFSELLSRFPDIEVCGPVRRLRSTTVNSIKSMPVRFTPER